MKKQILAQLKKKFPGVPEKVLGFIADKLALKVTEEDAIEGAIDELNDGPISIQEYANLIQREGDSRVQAALAKAKKAVGGEDTDPEPEAGKPDPNSEIGKLTKMITDLTGVVGSLVKEKTETSMKDKLKTAIGKDVPESFYKRVALPEKDEDIEALAEEIKADWKESGLTASGGGGGIGSLRRPTGSNSTTIVEDEDDKVDSSITTFNESLKKAAEDKK